MAECNDEPSTPGRDFLSQWWTGAALEVGVVEKHSNLDLTDPQSRHSAAQILAAMLLEGPQRQHFKGNKSYYIATILHLGNSVSIWLILLILPLENLAEAII